MNNDLFHVNKKVYSIISLENNDKESYVNFWLSKTPQERIQAVEFLRQQKYSYDPATERFQRFFESAEFKTS